MKEKTMRERSDSGLNNETLNQEKSSHNCASRTHKDCLQQQLLTIRQLDKLPPVADFLEQKQTNRRLPQLDKNALGCIQDAQTFSAC